MNLEMYTELRKGIDAKLNKANDTIQLFKKNSDGSVNMCPEFKTALTSYNTAFNELRTLNKFTPKQIMKTHRLNKRKW